MVNAPFLECAAEGPDFDIALLGIPYDGAVSYRHGAAAAPGIVRLASESVESYSPYVQLDLTERKIRDFGDIDCSGTQTEIYSRIEKEAFSVFSAGKKLLAIGGDHSVSFPLVSALGRVCPLFHVLQLDAHCDLRPEYEGNPYSHACAVKNIKTVPQVATVYQYGIRSGTKEEFAAAKRYELTPQGKDALFKELTGPLYLTLDVDFFDPAFLPGTGTPEPNGAAPADFLTLLELLGSIDLLGCDVVELAPELDPSGRSAVMGAWLIRELLLRL